MSYCSDTEIATLLDGTSHLKRGTETDFSVQIEAAAAWVAGWLEAAGVKLPLGAVPELVRWAAANYACYLIVRRPNTAGQFEEMMKEFRTEAYRQRDDYLAGRAQTVDGEANKRHASPPAVVNLSDAN